jgi:hypothetical protein
MSVPYRFAGAMLAQAAGIWDVQKQNMGMLELTIDGLVPGGKEILMLSLQEFTVPGRTIATGELPYLNGRVKYAAAPQALGNITVTYRDFPLTKTRAILNQWFRKVYDEATGLMLPMGLVKTTGYLVLFQSHGLSERTARLEGIFPVKEPDIAVQYAQGEHMPMQIELSADRMIWEPSLFNPSAS